MPVPRRLAVIVFTAMLVLVPLAHSPDARPVAAAGSFADPAFQNQWNTGEAVTPNFYGPLMTAHEGQQEPYVEAPGGMRLVQYFDKARVELNNPTTGVVTNGLLATELVKGQIQAGDSAFQNKPSPAISVAGDPSNIGPTYAQIGASGLTAAATSTVGQPTTRALTSAGAASTFAAGGSDANATVAAFDTATQHNVPAAFDAYRTKAGLLTIGFAIAEPFWANGVLVGGQPKDVLVQAFERRVLTYTPSNPDAFKVEFGNIGAHYFTWRYSMGAVTTGPVTGTSAPASTATSAPASTATSAPANTATSAPTSTAMAMPTKTPAPTMTPTTTPTMGAAMTPANNGGTVFVIMLENKNSTEIYGNSNAPFLNQLAAQHTIADHYFGVRHPSLPNYIALIGGDTFGVDNDCPDDIKPCQNKVGNAPNLVDGLEAKGKTWKAYEEDMPNPCYLGNDAGGAGKYAAKHNPFVYFADIRTNAARCNRMVPLTQFDTDMAGGQMPDFVWITPNLIHDMHDGCEASVNDCIRNGDQWLASFVPKILSSPAYQQGGELVITWDEAESINTAGCCNSLAVGGDIATLILMPNDVPGSHIAATVTHYNLLRTLEDRWGLMRVGHSADAGVAPLLAPSPGTATSASEQFPPRTLLVGVDTLVATLPDRTPGRTGTALS